jgi:hypothetical protein
MGYGFAGSISPKAAKKLNSKLAVLRGTKPQKSKIAPFNGKSKDEGGTAKAEIPVGEINHPTNQGGSARNGRHVSKGGGVGKAESQVNAKQIDQPENKKTWPKGGGVSASNPKTGNTRMRGPIAKTGGPYGGGGRDTQ